MRIQDHIATEALLDYLEERADAATAARIDAHLSAGCPRCTEAAAFWRRALRALPAAAAPAPPEAVVARALALFPRRVPHPSPRERLVAALTFDSRLQPAPAGVRDLGTDSFQLLFQVAGMDIDLLCEREGEGWRITGQALPAAGPPREWRVSATRAGAQVAGETEAGGEFRLTGVPPGEYEIVLRSADREILLRDVRLEERVD